MSPQHRVAVTPCYGYSVLVFLYVTPCVTPLLPSVVTLFDL